MLNDSSERPADANVEAAANSPPADRREPALILLAADEDAVCVDDACLPGDAPR